MLFLALFSDRAVGLAVAVMVLLAVVLSPGAGRGAGTTQHPGLAGLLSGLAGTATSIGGPPVALLYQHRPPQQIRSTLAVVFTVGAAISLVGIWLGGHLDTDALPLACCSRRAWWSAPGPALACSRCCRTGSVRYAVLASVRRPRCVLLVRSLL